MENAFKEIALQAENHKRVQNIISEHRKEEGGKVVGIDGVSKEIYENS